MCVYCSSSSAVDPVYAAAARALGAELALRGHSLVYGGTVSGLMGALARAAQEAGAHVTAVIPRRLQELGVAYDLADELVVTETMGERKAVMAARADGFVSLPGGFGTLEELLEILTLKQLGYLAGPVTLLNVNGFYEPLLAFFERLYAERFAKPAFRQLYGVAADAPAALSYLEDYTEVDLPSKLF
ncbi:MAG: LOG family protein [Anaerolineae bacterium]